MVARPNMRVVEAAPTDDRLRAMNDDELAAMFARYSIEQNWAAFGAVDTELGRREAESAWLNEPRGDDHWNTREDTDTDRQMDALIARGYTFADAHAEVHDTDAARMRQQERAGAVDKVGTESADRALRRSYDQQVYEQWLRAEEDLRGHLLSREGQANGVDPIDLFSGPASTARKYASEDLQRWWADHGRMTFTQYRAATLGRAGDVAAAERTRLGSNARDFI